MINDQGDCVLIVDDKVRVVNKIFSHCCEIATLDYCDVTANQEPTVKSLDVTSNEMLIALSTTLATSLTDQSGQFPDIIRIFFVIMKL